MRRFLTLSAYVAAHVLGWIDSSGGSTVPFGNSTVRKPFLALPIYVAARALWRALSDAPVAVVEG